MTTIDFATVHGDFHVHSSTFSDDAHSPIEDNIAAAVRRGLAALCVTEHVRATSTHIPDVVAAVAAHRPAAARSGLNLLASVETKMLTSSGDLDLPTAGLTGLDLVHVADHQLPLDAPTSPRQAAALLAAGTLTPADVCTSLIDAYRAALATAAAAGLRPLLAHPFSILPKAGLDEAHLTESQLAAVAADASRHGALVEVNTKWRCPSLRSLTAFAAAGVTIVTSTDAHHARDVGQLDWAGRARADVYATADCPECR